MLDDTTRYLLFGAGVPLALAGGLMLLGAALRPRSPLPPEAGAAGSTGGRVASRDGPAWRSRVALGVGVPPILAFLVLFGWPIGTETWRTAAYAPMLGLACALAIGPGSRPWWTTAACAVVGPLLALLVMPYTRPEPAWVRWLPAAFGAALVLPVELLARRRGSAGRSLAVALALAGAAAGGLVLFSGFMKLSVPLVAMTTGAACVCLAAWRRSAAPLAGSAAPIVTLTAATALYHAWLNAKFLDSPIPTGAFALVAAAPLAAWVGELAPIARRRAWVAGTARVALVAGMCAAGVAMALLADEHAEAGDDPYSEMYGLPSP